MVKLLSVVDLPTPVSQRFESRTAMVRAGLAQAGGVEPDAILCSITPYRFDRSTIESLPTSVKIIATYSVGSDHIDLDAAADRDIAVFNTPGVLSEAVADVAMLLLLGAARRATESTTLLRQGKWSGWTPSQLIGQGLDQKTMGILGMGDIGRRIATRATAFGMNIAYHNRREIPGEERRYYADPRELVADADVLVLAWPSSTETRYFISAETLALAKPSMVLVNIGRGDLVKDDDLIAALREGKIAAAGLDVFDNEPDIHRGYLDLPNAFLTPHIGSSTWEARLAMADILLDAIDTYVAGGNPKNRIA